MLAKLVASIFILAWSNVNIRSSCESVWPARGRCHVNCRCRLRLDHGLSSLRAVTTRTHRFSDSYLTLLTNFETLGVAAELVIPIIVLTRCNVIAVRLSKCVRSRRRGGHIDSGRGLRFSHLFSSLRVVSTWTHRLSHSFGSLFADLERFDV